MTHSNQTLKIIGVDVTKRKLDIAFSDHRFVTIDNHEYRTYECSLDRIQKSATIKSEIDASHRL
jgi:hypothetical protein